MQIDPSFLMTAVRESTSAVFSAMLDLDVEMLSAAAADEDSQDGIVAFVGLTGPWRGTGSILCTPATAGLIASRMLMADSLISNSSVNDEIMDAVGEVTNMVIGNIKNSLEVRLGALAISIPTVIYGRNLQFRTVTGHAGLQVPFAWEGGCIEVRLSLAPAPRHAPLHRNVRYLAAA